MEVLVDDVIWEIMRHLSYRDLKNFSLVRKRIRTIYTTRSAFETVGKITLYMGKKVVIDQMINSSKQISILNAPPSYGKTLVGIFLALRSYIENPIVGVQVKSNSERFVILVPTKTLKMWIDEIKNHLPHAIDIKSPRNSIIVIDDKKYPIHSDYLSSMSPGTLSERNKVIIHCHYRAYRKWWPGSNSIYSNDMNVIIDEAHTGHVTYNTIAQGIQGRIFLLSATKFNLPYYINRDDVHHINIPREEIKHNLPPLSIHCSTKDFKQILLRNIEKRDKIVIFDHRTSIISQVKEIIAELPNPPKVFKFVSSMKYLNDFHRYPGKAILVTAYSKADVGISIKAEASILCNALDLGVQRIYQVISRIIRINNLNKNVFCTLLVAGDENLARIKLAMVLTKIIHNIQLPNRILLYRHKKIPKDLQGIPLLHYIYPKSKLLRPVYIAQGLIKSKKVE
jgi:hypothetical protein